MPTWVLGSSRQRRGAGFTLIELMVVVALVALAAGLIAQTVRDPAQARLEQDAARLVALLESARTEARASGLDVRWVPASDAAGAAPPGAEGGGFRFVGLPASLALPTLWLDGRVTAEVEGAPGLVLGPDAILPPQRLVLRLEDRRLEIASDGLAAFSVQAPAADASP